jgi:excisionase family DNA binding protein
LTLEEAAEQLGVHYMTAYRYVRLGVLPARKVGGTWQVQPQDVHRLRAESVAPSVTGRARRAPWATRYEARLLAGDEGGAWGVVERALSAGTEPQRVLLDVVAPAMRSIGDAWERGELDVAEEHRASQVALRTIGRLGPRFFRRGRSKGTVVVGAVEGERHSLPLFVLADLLRGAGWTVTDLGGDVPTPSFASTVAGTDGLVAVGVSVSTASNLDRVPSVVDALRDVTSAPVLVGGRAVGDEAQARRLGGDGWAPDGGACAELLGALTAR